LRSTTDRDCFLLHSPGGQVVIQVRVLVMPDVRFGVTSQALADGLSEVVIRPTGPTQGHGGLCEPVQQGADVVWD